MKKIFSPIIWGTIGLIIICLYLSLIASGVDNIWGYMLIGIIIVSVSVAMIFTIKERINEIKEESEDDISKY